MRTTMMKMIALLAVLLLVGAACGDSGGNGNDPFGIGTATTSDPGTSPGGGDTGGDNATVPTLGTLLEGIPGLNNECLAVANVFLAMGQVIATGGAGSDALLAEAAAGIPAELQDDLAVIATALAAYSNALEDAGIDLTDPGAFGNLTEAQINQLNAIDEIIDSDEVNQAFDNFEAYGDAQCADFGG